MLTAGPIAGNIAAIAESFGRMVGDVTTIVLDRPRHHDLIEEIRAAGARIKLIQDGDVTASISAAIRGTNDHLAIGIGGTRQAVLSAAALRILGEEAALQDEVVQAALAGGADVHAGTLAHCLEPLEDEEVGGVVRVVDRELPACAIRLSCRLRIYLRHAVRRRRLACRERAPPGSSVLNSNIEWGTSR